MPAPLSSPDYPDHADADGDGIGDECDCDDTVPLVAPGTLQRWPCEDQLRGPGFIDAFEAVMALAEAFDQARIEAIGPDGFAWSDLKGCLTPPCPSIPAIDPALSASAYDFLTESLETGRASQEDLWAFALEHGSEEVGGYALEHFVGWLVSTHGEELYRP